MIVLSELIMKNAIRRNVVNAFYVKFIFFPFYMLEKRYKTLNDGNAHVEIQRDAVQPGYTGIHILFIVEFGDRVHDKTCERLDAIAVTVKSWLLKNESILCTKSYVTSAHGEFQYSDKTLLLLVRAILEEEQSDRDGTVGHLGGLVDQTCLGDVTWCGVDNTRLITINEYIHKQVVELK